MTATTPPNADSSIAVPPDEATNADPPPPSASSRPPEPEPKSTDPRREHWMRPAVVAASMLVGGIVGAGGFALGLQVGDSSPAGDQAVAITLESGDQATETAPVDSVQTTSTEEPAARVANMLGPSVVQVETDLGLGSGVVYAEGLVITNHHVIVDASEVAVRTSDGLVIPATVLGSDERHDIAVLSATDGDLLVAALGSSSDVMPGETAIAIGSPFQLQQTVTAGIISSVNRPVPNADGSVTAMIQTDAAINPGNSGGALANVDGEVIGINSSIRTDGFSNTNVGIGFAVPIDTAVKVTNRIVAGEPLESAVLGVSGATQDDELGVPLATVEPGSAADQAGLLPGDRVIAIDDAPVTTIGELAGLVQSHFRGDQVRLELLRGSERVAVTAVLD